MATFSWFKRRSIPVTSSNAGESQALIRLREVKKAYKAGSDDVTVLKGLNLEFQPGEFIGIIGKSGSGKSTLLNMITGIDHPTSGEVWVGSTPVHLLSEGQVAVWRGRNLGIIFQFFQLLPMLTLVENVMLPMDFCGSVPLVQRRERALQLLDLVEMADHADKLPSAVSGGQQQRAAIARALANDPPVILADEPTGNLDTRSAEAIFNLFLRLVGQGKTIIMVTHDNALAKRVSRSILLADGEIASINVQAMQPA